jgi:hypothetical protein
MEYVVIDNFFNESDFKDLKSLFFSSDFPYHYQNGVTYEYEQDEYYYFNHTLFSLSKVRSDWYYFVVSKFLNVTNFKEENILRGKVNLFPREKEVKFHSLHVDDDQNDHLVVLWYANTTNAPTLLKTSKEEIFIDCIENRCLIFDGKIMHGASSCSDQKIRVNVNLNFKK